MPLISIVIPTFNSRQFIGQCLDSLSSQDCQDFETIVIDNNSKDGTVSFIRERYPKITLIRNKQNGGACKARNQGIEIASGRWVVTLDCDVILRSDFLSQLQKTIQGLSSRVGMIQPIILKSDQKTIDSLGVALSFLRKFYDLKRGKMDNGQFNNPKYIFGACSAAAVYNKDMLKEIKEDTGYFDERFFFLVEDVDLAWRAQHRGWKALFCPRARCYHSGNSSNFDRKLRQYLCFRNRYYSILKNEGWLRYFLKIIPPLFYDLPRLFYLIFTNRYIFNRPKFIYN